MSVLVVIPLETSVILSIVTASLFAAVSKAASAGFPFLYFNPIFQRWLLEHYQMDEGIPARTIKEFMQKRRIEKRDRLLVRKKFYYTDFSKNSQLKKETWRDKKKISWCTLKQLFGFQNN